MNVGRGGQGQLTVTGGATVLIHDNSQLAAGDLPGSWSGASPDRRVADCVGRGLQRTVNQTGLGTNNPAIERRSRWQWRDDADDGLATVVNGSIQRDFVVAITANDGAGR